MENAELTETVLEFVRAFVDLHGYPPSQREIATGCYLSRSGVVLHLNKLEAQGRIMRQPRRARGISVQQPVEEPG